MSKERQSRPHPLLLVTYANSRRGLFYPQEKTPLSGVDIKGGKICQGCEDKHLPPFPALLFRKVKTSPDGLVG